MEIVFLLRETTYNEGSYILRQGDITDRIFILWQGQITAEVVSNEGRFTFDVLNPGSCFAVFSAFSDDMTQILDFRATNGAAVIYPLKASDLIALSKSELSLADKFKQLFIRIKNKTITPIDVFRNMQNSLKRRHTKIELNALK